MSTRLNTTQNKIIGLARLQRGSQSRKDFFGNETRISYNTYANFESGSTWPRSGNMRVIEDVLGWKPGVIDEAVSSGIAPGSLTLAHMHGQKSFGGRTSIQDFSNEEFFADLPRRLKEVEGLLHKLETYTLAASDDLGGIAPDQIEES